MRTLILCRGSGTKRRPVTLGMPKSEIPTRPGLVHARPKIADTRRRSDRAFEIWTMRSERPRAIEFIGWQPRHFQKAGLHESDTRNRIRFAHPRSRSAL